MEGAWGGCRERVDMARQATTAHLNAYTLATAYPCIAGVQGHEPRRAGTTADAATASHHGQVTGLREGRACSTVGSQGTGLREGRACSTVGSQGTGLREGRACSSVGSQGTGLREGRACSSVGSQGTSLRETIEAGLRRGVWATFPTSLCLCLLPSPARLAVSIAGQWPTCCHTHLCDLLPQILLPREASLACCMSERPLASFPPRLLPSPT